MASLDARATVLETARGDVQLATEGEGPPVLAIHGGPGGFDQGLAWCRHLRDAGCKVLAPSRPGYLRTPLESGRSPESQADLFAAMLDALHIRQIAVLGYSSGGPCAVHFAARHPERTAALLLDAAILQRFDLPIGRIRQATIESGFVVWLSWQMARKTPGLMTTALIDGTSRGLSREQKRAAARWITSDPARLQGIREQWASIAPPRYRAAGWRNDKANEAGLAPLPFSEIRAPTLIAHGANDAIVPVEHATRAAVRIAGAELMMVEEGHHLLSASRHYGPVAARQAELVRGCPAASR